MFRVQKGLCVQKCRKCNTWVLSYDSRDQEEVTTTIRRMNRSLGETEEVLPAWVTTQVWASEATEVADTPKGKKKRNGDLMSRRLSGRQSNVETEIMGICNYLNSYDFAHLSISNLHC